MNEQDCKKLAELLFPDVDKTPDYYEEKYPYRKLPNKAEVTRLGFRFARREGIMAAMQFLNR